MPTAQEPQVPTMDDLFNMINAMTGKGGGRGRQAKGQGKAGERSPSGDHKHIFMFRGCWQCASPGYSRHECPQWTAVLDKDVKPPPGRKGAKDKAYLACKAKRDAKKDGGKGNNRVNSLGQEDTEDEDNDYYDIGPGGPDNFFAFKYVDHGAARNNAQVNGKSRQIARVQTKTIRPWHRRTLTTTTSQGPTI